MGMFDDLANVRGGDVKPPVTLPTGHYEAILEGPMTPHKAAKSGNVAMRFPCRITSATDDVDQESLNTVLEQNPDALSKKFNLDFWMSPDARYRFTDFATSCGIDVSNLTLPEIAERLVEDKVQFTVLAKHEPNTEDPEKPPFVRWDNPVGHEG
jgi:hypothetical protein